MQNLTDDVLTFMDTGDIAEQWIANDLASLNVIVLEDFLDELDIQEQLNESEITDAVFINSPTSD